MPEDPREDQGPTGGASENPEITHSYGGGDPIARAAEGAPREPQQNELLSPYTYDYGEYTQHDYPDAAAEDASPPDSAASVSIVSPQTASGGSQPPANLPPPAPDQEEDEEEGMLRMSFLEHLEELRLRIIYMLAGLGVTFVFSLIFADELWDIVRQPAARALTSLGYPPDLVYTSPMDAFMTIWVKVPVVAALFLASPWILYQVWAFVSPGLYKRERRWAAPFIICTAGLFILGGLFAYFVAFRLGLTFLLGIGKNVGVRPMVTITEYSSLFVNVTLGVALIFELPVLIFFLTLIRVVTPGFLLRNARYAILIIIIIAAIITPTPDAVNLAIITVPMVVLYFAGVFVSYLLVLSREGKRFPWRWVLLAVVLLAVLAAGAGYLGVLKLGYRFQLGWPFLVR